MVGIYLGFQFFKYKIEARITDLRKLDEHINRMKTRRMLAEQGIDIIDPENGLELVKEIKT